MYKISIKVSLKNKVACSGNWTHNWPPLVYKSDAYPTVLSRHVLAVLDFQILTRLCSIESRNDPSSKREVVHETKFSLKISYSTHATSKWQLLMLHFIPPTSQTKSVNSKNSTKCPKRQNSKVFLLNSLLVLLRLCPALMNDSSILLWKSVKDHWHHIHHEYLIDSACVILK